MKNLIKNIKHKKLIGTVLIVAIAGLSLFVAKRYKGQKETETEVETGKAEVKTIVNTVSGTGTFESLNSTEITGTSAGSTIKSINVAVGDTVFEGQVIAVMDTSSEEEQIKDLKQRIADVKKQQKDQQEAYDKAVKDANEAAERTRKQALETALRTQAQNDARVSALDNELKTANTNMAKKAVELKALQDALTALKRDTPAAEKELQPYKEAVSDAESAIQAKQIEMALAQTQISSLTTQKESAEYIASLSRSSLSGLDSTETENTTTDTSANTASITDNTVDLLNDQIKNLQKRIEEATIKAKASGTVTEVSAKAGSVYLGGTIALIETENTLQIVSSIDEYDIPDVSVGMKAKIKTDATRDQILEGTVTFVAPKASSGASSMGGLSSILSSAGGGMDLGSISNSQSASYEVRISLDTPSDRLRLGMNANISIITKEKKDVLSVPFEAIQTKDDNSKYVVVRYESKDEKGKTIYKEKEVPVITGLEGTSFVEILEGDIKAGDDLVLIKQKTENSVQDLMNMMGSDAGI